MCSKVSSASASATRSARSWPEARCSSPRGTPHSFWNPGPGRTRYLLVMTPRIHGLVETLHAGDRTDYAAIFEEYESELLA